MFFFWSSNSRDTNQKRSINYYRYKYVGRTFFRFVTVRSFDAQTDGRTYGQMAFFHGDTVRCITFSRAIKTGSTDNAGQENKGPMRDQTD